MNTHTQSEAERVRNLLARTKRERERERARQDAINRIAAGEIASAADAEIEPTDEWFQHGPSRTYTPRQDENSTRVVRTVRRVQQPYIALLFAKDKINEDQLRVCIWYRMMRIAGGIEARVKIAQYENVVAVGEKLFGNLPRTEREALARKRYRDAERALGRSGAEFFNRSVIDDKPLLRSAKSVSKAARRRVYLRFSRLCDVLLEHCERTGVELSKVDPERDS